MPNILSSNRLLPVFALGCALLWGSAFPTIKWVYSQWEQDTYGRFLFAGVRFALAGLLVLAFVRQPNAVRRLREARVWGWLLCLTLTQTLLQYILFYTALSLSSAVLGSLLVSSGSFMWVILAPLFHKTAPPSLRQISLLVLAAFGITVAVYAPGAGAGNPMLGCLCFLSSNLMGILGILTLKPIGQKLDAMTATGFSLLCGGALLILLGAPAWDEWRYFLHPSIAGITFYLAVVSGAAFSLWNTLAGIHSANVLSGYRFLIPLAAVLLSTLFVAGETPGSGIWIGGGIIITALILLSRIHRKH